jgi:hypothetical protein
LEIPSESFCGTMIGAPWQWYICCKFLTSIHSQMLKGKLTKLTKLPPMLCN